MKVRLMCDLTKYDPNLVEGVIGTAREDKITYTDWEEELVEVKFPNADALPIAWRSLEKLDKKFWFDRERDIKQAVKIIYVQGPRGGFKWLRIYSNDRSKNERIYTTTIKHDAEKLLEFAKHYNKEITREIYRNNKEW